MAAATLPPAHHLPPATGPVSIGSSGSRAHSPVDLSYRVRVVSTKGGNSKGMSTASPRAVSLPVLVAASSSRKRCEWSTFLSTS